MRNFLLLLFMLMVLPARAAQPLLLDGAHHSLVGHLAVLVDAQHELGIESVVDADFKELDAHLNLGFTPAAAWLRFTVIASTGAPWWLEVSPAWLSKLTLYVPDAKGGFEARQTGYAMDPGQREVSYRNAIFRLDLPIAQPQTFYLRVESTQSLRAKLDFWQPQSFAGEVAWNQFGWGIYAGLVVALMLSICWFWWITGDTAYLVMGTSAVMMLMMRLLSEGGLQHWLAISPALLDPLVGCAVALTSATGTQFVNRFTKLENYLPRFARVFTASVWLMALLACLRFWLGLYTATMPLLQVAIIGTVLLHIVLTAWLVKRGQAQSMTVLIALASFWFVVPVRMGQTLGWIPLILNDTLMLHASQIAYLSIMNYAGHLRYAAMRLENANTQTLHEAVTRLEQANALERATHQAHRQFVATMSHELRNPLAVVDASIQNMAQLGGSAFDEKTRARIEKIQHATDRLTLIIDECLTPEHLDIAPDASQRKQVLLHEMLHDLALDAKRFSSETHTVVLACDPALTVNCNPTLLKLALRTLVDNALKYTPAGTVIHLRGEVDAQTTLIEVSDDGPGIDAHDLPHIFEKFYRGRTSGLKPGTGLGLALALQVVESHGGVIEVASPQGSGAAFTVRLPRGRRRHARRSNSPISSMDREGAD